MHGLRGWLVGLALLSTGCLVRAPPPMQPLVSGGVASEQHSSGEVLLGAGWATDLLTAIGGTASVNGRVRFGDRFDLGLGGIYGASGVQYSWSGRFSPRFYVSPPDAPVSFAVELGLSGGTYQEEVLTTTTTSASIVHLFRTELGGIDVPLRWGGLIHGSGLEIGGAVIPFFMLAGDNSCDPQYAWGSCIGGNKLYHAGVMGEFTAQHTWASGITLGGQLDVSMGLTNAGTLIGFSYGMIGTFGYRFGFKPPGQHIDNLDAPLPPP